MDTTHDVPRSFPCDLCPKLCSLLAGLARHKKLKHPDINPPKDLSSHTRFFHPLLNGMRALHFSFFGSYRTTARPCDEDGTFLQALWGSTPPLPASPSQDDQHLHDWSPFEDWLAFDWAYQHYVKVQSSAAEIAQGLDFWSAISIKHGSTPVHLGEMQRKCTRRLTLSKSAHFPSKRSRFDTLDQSPRHLHLGWNKSIN